LQKIKAKRKITKTLEIDRTEKTAKVKMTAEKEEKMPM
jgi:hypothetical protein